MTLLNGNYTLGNTTINDSFSNDSSADNNLLTIISEITIVSATVLAAAGLVGLAVFVVRMFKPKLTNCYHRLKTKVSKDTQLTLSELTKEDLKDTLPSSPLLPSTELHTVNMEALEKYKR